MPSKPKTLDEVLDSIEPQTPISDERRDELIAQIVELCHPESRRTWGDDYLSDNAMEMIKSRLLEGVCVDVLVGDWKSFEDKIVSSYVNLPARRA